MSRIRWGGFASGLIGVVVGAVLMASMPVLAGNGDPLLAGEKTNATRTTKLVSKGGLTVISGKDGNPALRLEVVGTTPPMTVNSTGLVANLNADQLDGFDGGDLVRLGFGSTEDAADADGVVATATVVAPTVGFLVVSGAVDASGAFGGPYQCRLEVDSIMVEGTRMISTVGQAAGGGTTDNSQENCSATGALQVSAGSHTVDFRVAETDGSVTFAHGAVWALFVPFDGSGAPADQ